MYNGYTFVEPISSYFKYFQLQYFFRNLVIVDCLHQPCQPGNHVIQVCY